MYSCCCQRPPKYRRRTRRPDQQYDPPNLFEKPSRPQFLHTLPLPFEEPTFSEPYFEPPAFVTDSIPQRVHYKPPDLPVTPRDLCLPNNQFIPPENSYIPRKNLAAPLPVALTKTLPFIRSIPTPHTYIITQPTPSQDLVLYSKPSVSPNRMRNQERLLELFRNAEADKVMRDVLLRYFSADHFNSDKDVRVGGILSAVLLGGTVGDNFSLADGVRKEDIRRLKPRVNVAAQIANTFITPNQLNAEVQPKMMSPEGIFPADFDVPYRVEEIIQADNYTLDRILRAYNLIPRRPTLSNTGLGVGVGGGLFGTSFGSLSSSNMSDDKQAKLIALFEYLGVDVTDWTGKGINSLSNALGSALTNALGGNAGAGLGRGLKANGLGGSLGTKLEALRQLADEREREENRGLSSMGNSLGTGRFNDTLNSGIPSAVARGLVNAWNRPRTP